jgi:GNAT superfamily N-acetyltransferase
MRVPERFRAGITRYRPADADALRQFHVRMRDEHSHEIGPAKFEWMFDRNPCRSPEGPGLWICRREQLVVGQQAEFRYDLSIRGQRQAAVWATDLMVDPAFRMRGVGPALMAAHLAGHRIAGGVNVSIDAYRMFLRAGFTDLGFVPVYVRPLDWRRTLRIAPVSPRLRRLSAAAAPVLRAFDLALGAVVRRSGTRLVPIDHFDDRVDSVWRAAAAAYPVLAWRDAAVLRWKLDERSDHDQLRRFLLVREETAVGYVVLRNDTTQRSTEPIAHVEDYLAPPRLVVPLLAHAAARARADGAIALVCKTLNAPADRRLRAVGFVQRQLGLGQPIRFMIHCTDAPELCALVCDPHNWLITAADIV